MDTICAHVDCACFFSKNRSTYYFCTECLEFTKFDKAPVCFREYDDWLDYSGKQASPPQLRKKAVVVYNSMIKALERQYEEEK